MRPYDKYQLGFHSPDSRVVLGEWSRKSCALLPGERVTVVGNYAGDPGTGAVTIRCHRTGAVYERDGYSPLFALGWTP